MSRPGLCHEVIMTRKLPRPQGAYVHAVRIPQPGSWLFVSGQLPIDLKGRTFTGDFKAATNMCLGYIKSILQDAGFLLNEVVRCDVYLTDLQQQGLFEQLYQQFFRGLILPARVIVGVQSLPGQASIMIAAVACKPSQPVPQAATTTMEDEEMYDEY